MKTTMSISLLGSLALMVSSVAAVPAVQARDVWSPRIISPTASTIWHLGHHQNVTWDTSDAPASITNKVFSVVLDGKTLASGFDPRAGIVTVVVDSSIPVGTYKLTLAGDASNLSPPFKVEA